MSYADIDEMNRLIKTLTSLSKEIYQINVSLFKIMIPIIIGVKILEAFGGIKIISTVLEPLMDIVGLPSSMGLIWATTMISNIYAGMIIFISNQGQEPLTVAQVTVLASMMLLAHALPIEVRIAQKAGVRILFTLLLRIGGALLIGFILHHFYAATGYLNQQNQAIWKPPLITDTSLLSWGINQLKTLAQIFVVISILVILLRILKYSGIEKLLIWLLQPILRIIGLSKETTSITIIGMTLGLTYGGGLLINEAQKGHITKIDIVGSLSLLALSHSLIEDTLLLMLLGADLSGILYFRILFTIILISLLIRFIKQLKTAVFTRYFIVPD